MDREGWLRGEDGLLKGANLREARLQDARLDGANLEELQVQTCVLIVRQEQGLFMSNLQGARHDKRLQLKT